MNLSNHFEDSKKSPFGFEGYCAQLYADFNELSALLSGYGLQIERAAHSLNENLLSIHIG